MIGGSSSALYAFMTAAPLPLIDLQSVSPEHFGRDMMLGPIGCHRGRDCHEPHGHAWGPCR